MNNRDTYYAAPAHRHQRSLARPALKRTLMLALALGLWYATTLANVWLD